MSTSIFLYGSPLSGHAYKVRLALAVADLPHGYEEIDINSPRGERSDAFQAAARFGQVPTLVVDGESLAQSDAILCWLARHTGRFGGESDGRMQHVLEWLFWEANRLGMCLPQLRWARSYAPHEYNDGTLEWLQARYDSDIARLEEELSDGRAFILDETPTVADFSLCGYLFSADEAKVAVPPHVRRWLANIASLPRWQAPTDLMKP
ncbi:MAG: glutathione S-transferase family protein [Beijerinckiaceae bacterium]|nr:glutathione S-transferase family protein [Beijerinckiaceae bacterium]